MFSFSLEKYPEMELLDPMIILFLIFGGSSIRFSTTAASVYVPTNSARGFLFLHILPTPDVSCVVDFSHSDRYEMISHCSVDLHFPDDE